LRTRGHGKPYQRTAASLVCRPHQLPLLVGQSIPAVTVFPCLHPVGNNTSCCAERHRTGKCLCEHIAPEVNQNRHCYPAQHTPHSLATCKQFHTKNSSSMLRPN